MTVFSKSEDIFKAVRSQLLGDKGNDKNFFQMRARIIEQLLYTHLKPDSKLLAFL